VGGGLDQLKKWESLYQALLNAKPDEEKTEEIVIGGKVVING
jgi:predicted RNA-binding protein with PUA domain